MADTSGLLAYFDRNEPAYERVAKVVDNGHDSLVVSPYVVAELDYLLASRLGVAAELEVLGELSGGGYDLAQLSAEDLRVCRDVVERYRDQSIGVTDASIVVLADRYSTRSILTLDRRHFDLIRPIRGGRFRCLP